MVFHLDVFVVSISFSYIEPHCSVSVASIKMADEKSDEATDDNTLNKKSKPEQSAVRRRAEYFEKLEKWLYQAYAWQSVAAIFPYCLMSDQIVNSSTVPNSSTSTQQLNGNNDQQNGSLRQRRPEEPVGSPVQNAVPEGFEYRIPPIWKRCVAEFIDSTMLFLLRLLITFIAIDRFGFSGIDDLDLLQIDLRTGYKMAFEMTFEIVVLEIAYCMIVCIFEAFWFQHGVNGRSGATPGKLMMELRVVQCRSVTPIERPEDPDLVLVSPGTDLDLLLTLRRSLVKSLMIASFFPVCFTLFFFRFNRTGYDLVCSSIVVEDSYRNQNNINRPHQN